MSIGKLKYFFRRDDFLTCVYLTTNLPGEHYRFVPKLMASMYASLA